MRQVATKGLLTVVATSGMIAAGGGLAYADAGAAGTAAGSPGVLSGNSVQVPVHVPVNLCGNTLNVIGALNPALGNSCGNASVPGGGSGGSGGGGAAAGGGTASSPGAGSGNSVQAPVDVPVNVCGNSVTLAGGLNAAGPNACGGVEAGPAQPGSPGAPGTPGTPGRPGSPGTPGGPGTPGSPGGPGGPGLPGTSAGAPPSQGTQDRPGTPAATHTSGGTGSTGVPGLADPGSDPASDPRPSSGGTATLAHTGATALGLAAPAGALLVGGALLYRRGRAAVARR